MQEEIRCPYCELKKMAEQKMVFKATNPINGECPECGAFIDAGQHKVEINDLVSIYEGACDLISYVVEWFNELLKEEDIELTNYLYDEEGAELNISTSFIIEELFAHNCGGTTKRNIASALEIQKDFSTWKISKSEVEEEW